MRKTGTAAGWTFEASAIVPLILAVFGCSPSPATSAEPSAATTASGVSGVSSVAASASAAHTAKGCSAACATGSRCIDGACKSICPAGEVFVPRSPKAGFVLGQTRRGETRAVLTSSFCVDATEVTVADYKACVDARACSSPRTWGMWINYPKKLDHPVNKVGWKQSRAYCQHHNKDLPTEAQWVWAATGGDGRKWAWGNETPTCDHADFVPGNLRGPSSDDGCQGGGTSPVASHAAGGRKTPFGVIHDLSGNVWEWCLDDFVPLKTGSLIDPRVLEAPDGPHVNRGGGWNRSAKGIQVGYRAGSRVDYQVPGLGFRCVRNGVDGPAKRAPAAER